MIENKKISGFLNNILDVGYFLQENVLFGQIWCHKTLLKIEKDNNKLRVAIGKHGASWSIIPLI